MSAPTEHPMQSINLALCERIRNGDLRAEAELVKTYGRGVRLLLEQRVGGRELAKDLFQETFRIVLLRLRSPMLEAPENLTSFIRQTAVNVALMDFRKRARRQRFESHGFDLEAAADVLACPLTRLANEQLRAGVRSVIAELPVERDRELLWHYYVLEEDKESLCRRFGLSSDHFDRVVSRARQRLRALLERTGNARG
jgi:RNA polymerase sigma factor (sigma-70 family)